MGNQGHEKGGTLTRKKRGRRSIKGVSLEVLREKVVQDCLLDKHRRGPKRVYQDCFDVAYGEVGQDLSDRAIDSFREMSEDLDEYLMLEWAILYSTMSPGPYLKGIKGYSEDQCNTILGTKPVKQWFDRKEELQNKVTETLVVRHIDLIAEVQDRHIKASNLAMAKATQMLLKGTPIVDENGNPVLNKLKVQGHKPLKSSDILNITVALKNVQDTYRKAMGFKDEEGITQIVEKVQMIQVNNTAIQPESVGGEVVVVEERKTALDGLSHDEVKALVARARELARRG